MNEQGPSREGISGERQSPDSGNWHPYTREELAFADAYQREQMQDAAPTTDTHWRH